MSVNVARAELTRMKRAVEGGQADFAQLARESNLTFLRSSFEPVSDRDRTLTRLKIEMSLSGNYADMRRFLHALETATEFVVIDNVQLAQPGEADTPLDVTLALSTYYRTPQP